MNEKLALGSPMTTTAILHGPVLMLELLFANKSRRKSPLPSAPGRTGMTTMSNFFLGPNALADFLSHSYALDFAKSSPTCELCCDDNPATMRSQARTSLTNQGISDIIKAQDQKGQADENG
jgi:hypothetical protein